MSAGLQILDEDGSVLLDTTVSCGRLLGVLTNPGLTGSQEDPRLAEGIPWGFVYNNALGTGVIAKHALNSTGGVSFSGTTLSWSFSSMPPDWKLVYGVR